MSNETEFSLPRRTPESQGISSSVLLNFLELAEQDLDALHSFMMVRRGNVIAEGWWSPYSSAKPHMLFSLSKSFASTAAGLAINEGLLTLDDKVLSFFPEDAPAEISENLAEMRVRDLLAMATGNAEDTTGSLWQNPDGNWVKAFLSRPVEYAPGTHFVYNSGATYMVAAIVEKVTDQTLLEYLTPRLFSPLGITGATWETCPRGISVGGWGLSITTEDIAKFGQLYLQKGEWKGSQLIPTSWVEEATSKQVSNRQNPTDLDHDWNQGYGYQFWRCRNGGYRGDGAFGQFCVVLPEEETVFAITSGIGNMGSVLNLIWEILLPALQPNALPENPEEHVRLQTKLSALKLLPPNGNSTSPTIPSILGKTYQLEPDANDSEELGTVGFDFEEHTGKLTVTSKTGVHTIPFGFNGTWEHGKTSLLSPQGRGVEERPIATSAAWEQEDTLELKVVFDETPFVWTIRCQFIEERLVLTTKINVAFGPTESIQRNGVRL